MARRYPNRLRKRKGRPPPNRYRGPRSEGFTSFDLGGFYDSILPDIRGPDRRRLFNEAGTGIALIAGLCSGALGLASAGFLGAAIGFGAGYFIAHALLVENRFIRR